MIEIVTQKCPSCKYIFREKKTYEKYSLADFTKITPAKASVIHLPAHFNYFRPNKTGEHVYVCVSSEVLTGDQAFQHVCMQQKNHFIACPKCGTVLIPDIAMSCSEEW